MPARSRRSRRTEPAVAAGSRGVAVTGRVEFRDEDSGVMLLLDGYPQSFVAPADPRFLAFEYVAHLGVCLDVLPGRDGPLAVTHVGGAGLTLPRYVQTTRPGSPQIVFEPDEALTAAVREVLPLPRGHRIRVRGVDGRTGVAALRDDSADVVVVDAFADGRVPPELTTAAWCADLARVLAPGGFALLNLPDAPGMAFVARVAAGFAAAGLPGRALVATHDILKGRRFGNVVLAASAADLDTDALDRALRALPFPSGVHGPAQVARLARSARAFTDDDATGSPPAPAGVWRTL